MIGSPEFVIPLGCVGTEGTQVIDYKKAKREDFGNDSTKTVQNFARPFVPVNNESSQIRPQH